MESTLKFDKTNLKLRIVFFLVGLLIMALGISIIAISNFGNGPWDAVNIGLSEKTGLSIGLCMNIVAFIQIIIGGIETHICVLQTAADLIKEGFEVYVVKDACASRNKSEYKTGLSLLQQYGAKVTCVEIALFELLKTAKHPNFKEIQALIK